MGQALALTQAALAAPSDLKGVFEIEAFRTNCITNYEKTTGRSDGEIRFEREKVLFMKLLTDPKLGKKIAECSRFSVYSSMVELFYSGLTLAEGQTYMIPYGTTLQFQVGYKGRLEQMSTQMPQIREVYTPEVVMTNELDNFIYTLGEEPRIKQHIPAKNRDVTPENRIEFVYIILDKGHRKKCFLMSRQQVLSIRDRFSQPYKSYIKAGGKWPDGNLMDPPFWITDEIGAFKKTVTKRAYDSEPKTMRMRALDEKLKSHADPEDQQQEAEDIDYGIANDESGAIVDNKQIAQAATPDPKGAATPESNPATSGGGTRTRRTKEQIAKDKADAEAKTKSQQAPAEMKVTDGGTAFDPSTGETFGGPGDDNPVDDLPDLDAFMK